MTGRMTADATVELLSNRAAPRSITILCTTLAACTGTQAVGDLPAGRLCVQAAGTAAAARSAAASRPTGRMWSSAAVLNMTAATAAAEAA